MAFHLAGGVHRPSTWPLPLPPHKMSATALPPKAAASTPPPPRAPALRVCQVHAAPPPAADPQAGGPGLVVDPAKIVWTPYNAERDYANYKT